MTISPEHSALWPKSRNVADAYEVSYTGVYRPIPAHGVPERED